MSTRMRTDAPPALRHGGGPPPGSRRADRLSRERRRRSRQRLLVVLAGVVLAAATAGLTAWLTAPSQRPEVGARGGVAGAAGPEQRTLLLMRHDGEGTPAAGATLLAAGSEDVPAVVMFLPVGTLVDIPGIGLDRLGLAAQYGGAMLLQAGVENTLGIHVDEVGAVTDSALAAFLGRTGGLELEVPQRLVTRDEDGTAQVRFETGRQFLDGTRLAEYWSFRARGEDELASFSRQQLVLDRLLTEAADPAVLDRLVAGGAPQLGTTADAEWVQALFADLVEARADGRLRYVLLPVEPFGGDGPDGQATFRLREGDVRKLVDEVLVASVPVGGGAQAIRVQVLNGVGVPGIGQEVDRRLDRGTFRIVLSDNARSFDFPRTRILVYDESERSLQAAERVRELLGVGTIEVSRQPQSVVDITIVVGADFLPEQDLDGEGGDGDQP